jgi:hypothetical protein
LSICGLFNYLKIGWLHPFAFEINFDVYFFHLLRNYFKIHHYLFLSLLFFASFLFANALDHQFKLDASFFSLFHDILHLQTAFALDNPSACCFKNLETHSSYYHLIMLVAVCIFLFCKLKGVYHQDLFSIFLSNPSSYFGTFSSSLISLHLLHDVLRILHFQFYWFIALNTYFFCF